MSAPASVAPDQAARERALDIKRHALVVAPAGSGKTSLLVMRFLKCLAVSAEPEEVVAITFTNKAAAEIRTRLVQALQLAQAPPAQAGQERALQQLAQAVLARDTERGWALLDNPNRLRALTIDSLNGELAARLPLLSGLGGRPAITEDARGRYEEAVLALFAELEDSELSPSERSALERVLRRADNRLDLLLEPLSEMLEKREQWLEALLDQRESGAETDVAVLTALGLQRLQQLARLLDKPWCEELLGILRAASTQDECFAWAAELREWPTPAPEHFESWRKLADSLLTQDKKPALRKIVNKHQGFPPGQDSTKRMNTLLKTLNELPQAEALAQACADVRDFPALTYPTALLAERQALARALLRLAGHLRLVFSRSGETDFTEIALSALRALSGEHGYSELLDRSDARIRHLLVDEMQDTSESQVRLLRLLTSGWVPGDGHSLFLVGDPQQSIYAFRKAEVRLFQSLWENRALGSLPLECITLCANFRSRPVLIDWFNASFGRLFAPQPDLQVGAVSYNPCRPGRAPEPSEAAAVTITACWQDAPQAEAEAVLQRVQALRAEHGAQASIAVLARTRRQLHRVIAVLRGAGLPLSCQDIDPLHDITAVREYLYLARALWHPEDRLAWAVLLRSPLVGLSHADLVALSKGPVPGGPHRSWPDRIRDALASDTLSNEGRQRLQHLQSVLAQAEADPELYGNLAARSEAVWHALGGPATLQPGEWHDLQAAQLQLRRAAASGEIDSLARFRRSLAAAYAAPSAGAIQVMTVHKAKGLEFDHVLLVGCGQKGGSNGTPLLHYRAFPNGVLLVPRPPSQLADDDPAHRLFDFMSRLQRQAEHNELLRLLYVACTRARESLHLFMALKADTEGRPRPATGSFAALLWPVIKAGLSLPPRVDAAPVDTIRLRLPPPSPRLPVDYRFRADDPAWRPPERRSLRPSEAALDAQEAKPREGDVYAQLVGVMYHEAMRRIAQDGAEAWRDGGASRRAAMAAGFRHRGLPEPLIGAAVERVLELLRNTLDSEAGRWLLAPREWSQTEYALAGYRDGQWVAAIIDRCFEDNGQLWVIDYKTSSEPAADAIAHYRTQLQHYAALLGALRGRPVRSALFLADSGRLVEID
jgi:ATP-dependent helicase/nuclease subunit A